LVCWYLRIGLGWAAVGLLIFGILWFVGLALRWDWVPLLALFTAFGAAALGLFLDPSAGLRVSVLTGPYSLLGIGDLGHSAVVLIPGALFALLAWDLAEFHFRLRLASPEDDIGGLERRHLSRLAVLALAGGGLSAFALTQHFKPSFGLVVILMVLSVWGIGRMVDWLLKEES
jgi:hypothetical protein